MSASRPARSDAETDLSQATVAYRVRFDECGADGAARAAAFVRYAQDVAWIHSERLGYDRAWYEEHALTWLVRALSLDLHEPASSGDVLDVTTRVIGFRRVWARRRTDVVLGDRLVARALTDWVMTDARGVPTRVPVEFGTRFSAPPEPFEPIRLPRPDVPATAASLELRVRGSEVDPYAHANNATWLDWVDEAVAAVGEPAIGRRRYLLEYLAPAPLGATLAAWAWPDDAGIACAIRGDGDAERLRARVDRLPGMPDAAGTIPGSGARGGRR